MKLDISPRFRLGNIWKITKNHVKSRFLVIYDMHISHFLYTYVKNGVLVAYYWKKNYIRCGQTPNSRITTLKMRKTWKKFEIFDSRSWKSKIPVFQMYSTKLPEGKNFWPKNEKFPLWQLTITPEEKFPQKYRNTNAIKSLV